MSPTGALTEFGAALLLGAAAALVFAAAWRAFFPPGVQTRFWRALSVLAHQTLVVDDTAEFLALYRRLGATLGGYLGRNLAVTAIGGLALAAAVVMGLAPLGAARDAANGRLKASLPALEAGVERRGRDLVYTLGGRTIRVAAHPPSARVAACWTAPSCLGLSLLGFRVVEWPAPPPGLSAPVIIRADHGDVTPLAPYLDDLESVFLLAFMVAGVVGLAWPSKRPRPAEPLILRQSDFALVQINEALKPLIRLAGDLETRLAQARLPRPPLDRPIFITGLARSGTTTLLNALTASHELGAHQYRDFPFLGAPLAWSRLQGAITGEVQPVERPHKDRILITKFSPEAFEEPLWRQFFPDAHAAGANQRLDARVSNPAFEAFFPDHLRKILHLRGAGRYVSKGNYNVGRLEYLARLFPDARFIIPVRAPLDHVASLVRQHELFTAYAQADPRVPPYLAAAGHYEFGPQRRAMALSDDSPAARPGFWADGDDALGYARQWAEVYGHVARLLASPLGGRIMLIRYEEFCAAPAQWLAAVVAGCGLADPDGAILAFAAAVSRSEAPAPAAVLARRAEIHTIVGPVAEALGYRLD